MRLKLFDRRSDLPLKEDATSRFLPWLVALMVFLSAIALAGVLIVNATISRWERDVSGTLTVQVAPAPGNAEDSAARTAQRVKTAVDLLRATPGVQQAQGLSQEQLVALLAPWLGDTELLRDLPLPQLIDVTIEPEAHVDLAGLASRLKEQVPGASLDDHRVWLSRLIGLSRTIEGMGLGALAMIGLVTALTVVYATRTGLAVHHQVIEVLHLVGAQDDYVARQFADRAFALALKGGAFGLALAVPGLIAITVLARTMEGGFLPDLSLPLPGWIGLAALPLIAALLSMLTARITVHRTLSRLP